MIIQPFPSGPFETNAYVVGCLASRKAAIIDPAPESSKKIITFLSKENLIPQMILLTHSHWDHIADASVLKQKFQIPLYVHPLDAGNVKEPGSDGLPLWIAIASETPDKMLSEEDIIRLGSLEFAVIHTPGHTPGGVCFYNASNGILFSGDTLFQGSIGNLSFPTASPEAMWKSLKKLAKLKPDTLVYPGHGPSTTIGKESWIVRAEQIFG